MEPLWRAELPIQPDADEGVLLALAGLGAFFWALRVQSAADLVIKPPNQYPCFFLLWQTMVTTLRPWGAGSPRQLTEISHLLWAQHHPTPYSSGNKTLWLIYLTLPRDLPWSSVGARSIQPQPLHPAAQSPEPRNMVLCPPDCLS